MILIHLVAGAHVELLMMGVLVTGVTLVVLGRPVSGLTVLGLAATIKITAAIAIPFIFWIWLAHLREKDGSPLSRRRTAGCSPPPPPSRWLFRRHHCGQRSGAGLVDRPGLGGSHHQLVVCSDPGRPCDHVDRGTLAGVEPVGTGVHPCGRGGGARGDPRGPVGPVPADRAARHGGMTLAMLAVLLLEPSTLPWYYTWVLCLAVAFTLPHGSAPSSWRRRPSC